MPDHHKDTLLADWRQRAIDFEQEIKQIVLGLDCAVRHITLAIFARGHVLLEGDVGVGKTTLLRAVACGLGGAYERIEGTIDLMPTDLVYHTYINESGKPQVDPGPILKHGEALSVFFFNEVNRARPQVHSLLLRVMAERSVTAFNREYFFPHLLVFAGLDLLSVPQGAAHVGLSGARGERILCTGPSDHGTGPRVAGNGPGLHRGFADRPASDARHGAEFVALHPLQRFGDVRAAGAGA